MALNPRLLNPKAPCQPLDRTHGPSDLFSQTYDVAVNLTVQLSLPI